MEIIRLNGPVGMKDEDGNMKLINVAKCGHNHKEMEAARLCLLKRIKKSQGISLTLCK